MNIVDAMTDVNSQTIVFGIIRGLHDLFTAVWIGGLIVLAAAVMPSARQVLGQGPQLRQLLSIVQKRLICMVYISMAGLLITGMLEARSAPQFGGLFGFGSPYAIVLTAKHLLVIAMIAIALYRSLVLARQEAIRTQRTSFALLMVNITLGVVVLLLSGILGALGGM